MGVQGSAHCASLLPDVISRTISTQPHHPLPRMAGHSVKTGGILTPQEKQRSAAAFLGGQGATGRAPWPLSSSPHKRVSHQWWLFLPTSDFLPTLEKEKLPRLFKDFPDFKNRHSSEHQSLGGWGRGPGVGDLSAGGPPASLPRGELCSRHSVHHLGVFRRGGPRWSPTQDSLSFSGGDSVKCPLGSLLETQGLRFLLGAGQGGTFCPALKKFQTP